MNTKIFNFTPYQEPASVFNSDKNIKKFDRNIHMTIGDDNKTVKYQGKILTGKINNHWGQFKLLISELMFLTYYWDPELVPNPIVVYPGSASGFHIYVLSQLFEKVTFHLFDKHNDKESAFYPKLRERPNIKIFDRYFLDSDVDTYKNRNDIFFISDIRNLSYGEKENESEKIAYDDLMLQRNWVISIRPVKAMIKLRLPWTYKDPSCLMLKGTAYLQAWAPSTSTELRLVCDNDYTDQEWDYRKVEEIMAYHNRFTRLDKYLNPLTMKDEAIYEEKGYYNDWDSCYTTIIIMNYLNKFNLPTTVANVKRMLDFLQANTNSKINLLDIREGKNKE
jgi:hypothetical protein